MLKLNQKQTIKPIYMLKRGKNRKSNYELRDNYTNENISRVRKYKTENVIDCNLHTNVTVRERSNDMVIVKTKRLFCCFK
jgi:hypothetical protein